MPVGFLYGAESYFLQRSQAPQLPPQEQELLPDFFFFISEAITATKSAAITKPTKRVVRIPVMWGTPFKRNYLFKTDFL